ncbi:hypothetical protein Q9323_14975 [Pseudomonas fulva]|uniref:hypothetical protein n=1 Tax=Pseudomonas fulva TaxID=47880 RepID=UPI000CE975FE|nr:hypothetical protein [Pseudomonas fulva]AVF56252.1 hypothetical protein AL527_14375 [Pseudomonas fulva]
MAAKNPNKDNIIAAWLKAEAEGMPMTRFVESVKGTDLEVSVQGLRNWTNKNPRASSQGTHSPSSDKASSRTGLNLILEFEQQYQATKDQALLSFLQKAVDDLKAQLAAAESQLRNQKEKMGLISPSVEE